MSNRNLLILLIVLLAAPLQLLRAQGETDVIRYSLQYPGNDPVSLVMPSVTQSTGFGGFQENPATMALFDRSFLSFGISSRFVKEEGTYLGTTTGFDDGQTGIGDLGFVYRVPTTRGSLVVGGGYSQTTDFNRAFAVNARNDESTLTDFYASLPRTDPLNEAAFQAYAIDDVTTGSGEVTSISIFRLLPPGTEYPGINQIVERTDRGFLGEYSAFIATEFQKDLMVGVSVGLQNGFYDQKREFLEDDKFNDYNDAFIDSDGDGNPDTDIASILNVRTIHAGLKAFSARIGFVYRLAPGVRMGGSYQYQGDVHVDEDFNTEIITQLDNGSAPFTGEDPGSFSYRIERPDRANMGITVGDLKNMVLSIGVEGVRYSTAGIEFEEVELSDREKVIDDAVAANYRDVINLRGGLEYRGNELFIPRIGYAYYQTPNKNVEVDRQFFSGGFTLQLFDNVTFDLGVQYALWEDQTELYSYNLNGPVLSERVFEDVNRWHVMGGFKIGI